MATLAYGSSEPPTNSPAPNTADLPSRIQELTKDWLPAGEPKKSLPKPESQAPDVMPGINLALLHSSDTLANSNLLLTAHGPKPADPAQEFQVVLNLARQQRSLKNYLTAGQQYTSLLEGRAPEDVKRVAMLELALMHEEANDLAKAQQILAQYLRRWSEDPSNPEIMLRQGLLYRRMGAPILALGKFYAVMTSSLTLKFGNLAYYQRLVLHAQTEIADTYYFQGKYEEAAEFLTRLLKQSAPELNRAQIEFKLLRSLGALDRHADTVARAQDFLARYPQAAERAEIQFLYAIALKRLGRNADALQQVMQLLKSQQATAESNPTNWVYWQQRAGNEVANQLYLESDYVSALEVYLTLAALNADPAWQLPVLYQIGLVYERLQQPEKAQDIYRRILAREKGLATTTRPGLKTVLDMAQWRHDFLNWQRQAERTYQTNLQVIAVAPSFLRQ